LIGKAQPKTPTIITKIEMPVAALHLAEDMAALTLIEQLLKSVDVESVTEINSVEERERNTDQIRSTLGLVRTWRRYAQIKMRRDFLAP
jgi:hypothetical protein